MPISEDDKIRIISHFQEQKNISKVAEDLGFDRKTVQRWVRRFQDGEGIHERPKSGRPQLMTQEVTSAAFGLINSKECTTAGQAATTLEAQGLTPRVLHSTTVARSLSRPGAFHLDYHREKPDRELTDFNKQQRLDFAKANLRLDWSKVLSTDRARFAFKHPGVSVREGEWLLPGERRKAKSVNNPSSVNLYMGISRFGVTVAHPVTGTCKLKTNYFNKKGEKSRSITAHEYQDVLTKTLLPAGERIFKKRGIRHWLLLQDNDPAHGDAHSVVAEYNKQHSSSIQILPSWPPNSPDLNPIENVWGWANRKARAVGCKTFDEYQQTVLGLLSSVPPKMCEALLDSIPQRLAECIKSNGERIRY
jgi:transposase-like protein